MIAELLDRDVVLDRADWLIGGAAAARNARPGDAAEIDHGVQLLKQSLAEGRREAPADPESRLAFIPRDPALSLLQAAEEHALVARDDAPDSPKLLTPVAGEAPLAGQQLIDLGPLSHVGDYSDEDVEFIATFLASLGRHLDERVAFELPGSPPKVTELEDDSRVILVGDWGTGAEMADLVAKAIRPYLTGAKSETHVIHLGDVYYAGTKREAQRHFLDHWPVKPDEVRRYKSWCLNGNHDMFAAAQGLLEVTLADPRFAGQVSSDGHRSTEFHLRGQRWQIIGLDSAWKLTGTSLDDLRGHAGFLGPQQRDWLHTSFSGDAPPTILLSHHQPFMRTRAGIKTVGNLLAMTEEVRAGAGVFGWFWGHEHVCITYGSRDGIDYAACVGHGAIPKTPEPLLTKPPEWELKDTYTKKGHRWLRSGFAVLDFTPDDVTIRYADYTGHLSKPDETIPHPA